MVPSAVLLTLTLLAGCGWAGSDDAPYDLDNLQPGERALVSLPCEFSIPPQNRLYVYGERITDAVLTLSPGDSLRVNGIAVKPLRPGPPQSRPSDEALEALYGEVPTFRASLASGKPPWEAAKDFLRKSGALKTRIRRAYSEALRSDMSEETALPHVLERLLALDTDSLLNWDENIRVDGRMIRLYWRGWKGGAGADWVSFEEDRSRYVGLPSPEARVREQIHFATTLYDRVYRDNGPCWYFITHGGTVMARGNHNVGIVEGQLEHARTTNEIIEGPLPKGTVARILGYEEGD